MFSESKVTEIYCMADDFCKEFVLQQEKYMIEDKKIRHRNKPNRMSDAEIMVILILFHSGGFRCFKHYYKEYVCKHLKHLFPRQVSYNRLPIEILYPFRIRITACLDLLQAFQFTEVRLAKPNLAIAYSYKPKLGSRQGYIQQVGFGSCPLGSPFLG